jgi:hypothetical protein
MVVGQEETTTLVMMLRSALSERWWWVLESREDVETALRSELQSGPEMMRESESRLASVWESTSSCHLLFVVRCWSYQKSSQS